MKTLQDLSAKITSLDRLVLQQPYLLNSRRAYIEIPSCARHVQFWYFLPTVLYSKLPACKVSKMHAKKANVMLSISHPCLSYAPCHKSYCAHTHFRPAGASKARLKVDDAVLESHKAAAWTLTLRDVKSNLFWQTKSKENQGFSTNAQSLLVWFTLIYSPQVPKSPLFQTCPIWTKHPPMANAIAHALMTCSPTHDHLIMLHGCAIPRNTYAQVLPYTFRKYPNLLLAICNCLLGICLCCMLQFTNKLNIHINLFQVDITVRCAAAASLVHLALHKKMTGIDIKEAKDFINKYVMPPPVVLFVDSVVACIMCVMHL